MASKITSGSNGAGFVLGILGMAVAVNYLHGGSTQVKAWLSAKFLNNDTGSNVSALGVPVSNPTDPATGVNPYDVHAAMNRQAYNAAHAHDYVGTRTSGGQVAGP